MRKVKESVLIEPLEPPMRRGLGEGPPRGEKLEELEGLGAPPRATSSPVFLSRRCKLEERFLRIFSRNDASVPVARRDSSLSRENIPIGCLSISSTHGRLLKYATGSQVIPSLRYSSCSALRVNSMKICCSFSLT